MTKIRKLKQMDHQFGSFENWNLDIICNLLFAAWDFLIGPQLN